MLHLLMIVLSQSATLPPLIVEKTRKIASVIDTVFSYFQLELNFLAGKSGATVGFSGKGRKTHCVV